LIKYLTFLLMKKLLVLFCCLALSILTLAQNNSLDELWKKYRQAKADTTKARLLYNMHPHYIYTSVDSAFIINKMALQLARKHHHKELERDILIDLNALYIQVGAAQPSLEICFNLLEEAKAKKDRSFEMNLYNTITMNYMLNLGDLENGKKYSYMSMQIPGWELEKTNCTSLFLNLGDIYTRLAQYDSARHYLNKAYELANSESGNQENFYTSMIKNNFGNLYLKMNQPEMAVLYYRQSLPYALSTNYTDVICESGLGMAKIYEKQQKQDSVLHYTNTSLTAATNAKNLSYMLQASNYLAEFYRKANRLDSAVKYFSMSSSIRDSLLSNEKVNKIKAMEMEQGFRQQELEQKAAEAREERRMNIQYAILLIGIVGLLIIALLLSRSFIVHHNWVRFLGVLSLLLVFEFINLYLHPLLDKLTGHSPIAMLLIMACIASLLIPLHHKLEHWITTKLVEKNKKIRLAEAKKIIEELES
jgi:protein-S-isoprenylcysteine O-methyltransferase Ste14